VSAPGIYPTMPEAEYRSTRAVSCSTLKRFAEAPAKAHVARADTDAMRAGRLIHAAVLEAWSFDARYQRTDLDRRGTKAWQEEEAAAASEGRQLVKAAEWDQAAAIRDAVMAHPTARELLAPGLEPEASVFWRDEATGLLCRARADGLRRADRVVVDVKTTLDASPDEFARGAGKWKHHWQEAFYRAGLASAPGGFVADRFVFIAVERDAPNLIGLYELSPSAVAQGEREVMAALREYAECERTGIWPGYAEQVVMLDLPAWAMEEEYVT
jgi:hypothetical protein